MKHSESYIQLCDTLGRPIADKVSRELVGKKALLHPSAHVWVWRKNTDGTAQVLLQKRADDKLTWPGHWDISAAGHLDYGEDVVAAAIRETQEELGLEIEVNDLELLFVHHFYQQVPGTENIENEYRWVYAYPLKSDVAMSFADGEVSDSRWIDANELFEWFNNPTKYKLVDQHHDYFVMLRAAIERYYENH